MKNTKETQGLELFKDAVENLTELDYLNLRKYTNDEIVPGGQVRPLKEDRHIARRIKVNFFYWM
jgi:hypothetical protein